MNRKNNTINNKDEIIDLFNSGKTIKEISLIYQYDKSVLRRKLKQWGLDTSKNKYNFPRNYGSNHHQWTGCGEMSGNIWKEIKRNALDRSIEFSITKEYIWNLFLNQNKCCALSGIKLFFDKNNRTASLDRIDSSKGYILGNVQWIHKNINTMKWNFPENDFINNCTKIVNFHLVKTRLKNWLILQKQPYWLN